MSAAQCLCARSARVAKRRGTASERVNRREPVMGNGKVESRQSCAVSAFSFDVHSPRQHGLTDVFDLYFTSPVREGFTLSRRSGVACPFVHVAYPIVYLKIYKKSLLISKKSLLKRNLAPHTQ